MDAGHFDAGTAYAAINTLRLDELRPHIYRTHDGGRTWTHITNGIPDGEVVNVVREDPKRRGLLYAGTEDQVWVSFDDGDHWSSLRLNMPATSIRDLVIKDDDLVVGTHGRSFYVLDGIAALRQIGPLTASSAATLFAPGLTWRFRFSKYPDTPIPPDEPWAPNPPDGALIDYFLGDGVSGDATLEMLAPNGRVVRTFTSRDTAMAPADIGNTPRYWIRPTQVLSAAPGFHRFVWDLHYPPPAGTSAQSGQYPISATPGDTPREPRGPVVAPGRYTVRLRVGGRTYTQPLVVRMDPRVRTSAATLASMHATSLALYDALARDSAITARAARLRAGLATAREATRDSALLARIGAFERALVEIVGQAGGARRGGGAPAAPTLASIRGDLGSLLTLVEDTDDPPTTQATAAVRTARADFAALVARWEALHTARLSALNAALRARGIAEVAR